MVVGAAVESKSLSYEALPKFPAEEKKVCPSFTTESMV